jgi:hypothetical protein
MSISDLSKSPRMRSPMNGKHLKVIFSSKKARKVNSSMAESKGKRSGFHEMSLQAKKNIRLKKLCFNTDDLEGEFSAAVYSPRIKPNSVSQSQSRQISSKFGEMSP